MKKLLIILFMTGCCTLNEDYVRQDRKDFDTMTPRIMRMLNDTTLFTDFQKGDIEDRLNARDAKISAAEALLKKED